VSTSNILLTLSIFGVAWPLAIYPIILRWLSKTPPRSGTIPDGARVVIIPCHNEEQVISKKILDIAAKLRKDRDRIIVVDDGSNDKTVSITQTAASQTAVQINALVFPRQGKHKSITAALDTVREPIVIITDANSVLKNNAIIELVKPFQDSRVGVVRGNYIAKPQRECGLGSIAAKYQHIERGRFLAESERSMLNVSGGTLQAFRRELFPKNERLTMTEDWDMTLSICEQGFTTAYADMATSEKYVSDRPKDLLLQNVRLVYGTIQTTFKHILRPALWRNKRLLLAFVGGKSAQVMTTLWLTLLMATLLQQALQGSFVASLFLITIASIGIIALLAVIIDWKGQRHYTGTMRTIEYLFLIQLSSLFAWVLFILRRGRNWRGWTPLQSIRN